MEFWGELLSSGIVPALVGALVGLFSRGMDRSHVQRLGRLDRSFDIKLARYTEYLDAVETLLSSVYALDYQGIDPRAESYEVDETPPDIIKADRALLVFAPEDIREAISAQMKLMPAAMEFLGDNIRILQQSQDTLIELMKRDLDLYDRKKRQLPRSN